MSGQGVRTRRTAPSYRLDLDGLDAFVLTTENVLIDTARIHAMAWKRVFDPILRRRARRFRNGFLPFDVHHDYFRHFARRPAADGVRGFLASRGIRLPDGTAAGDPSADTVSGLCAREDVYFLLRVRRYGLTPDGPAVALLRELRRHGLHTIALCPTLGCADLLRAGGVLELFDAWVDAVDAAVLGLPDRPDPARHLLAARRLAVPPARTAIVEATQAGVLAGRRGRFGLVIGLDRTGRSLTGADVTVRDLTRIRVPTERSMSAAMSAAMPAAPPAAMPYLSASA